MPAAVPLPQLSKQPLLIVHTAAAVLATGMVKMVDVTSIVKASNGNFAFLLVRPFRRNQEVASGDTMAADTLNGGANVCFHSLAAATVSNRPRLLVY